MVQVAQPHRTRLVIRQMELVLLRRSFLLPLLPFHSLPLPLLRVLLIFPPVPLRVPLPRRLLLLPLPYLPLRLLLAFLHPPRPLHQRLHRLTLLLYRQAQIIWVVSLSLRRLLLPLPRLYLVYQPRREDPTWTLV